MDKADMDLHGAWIILIARGRGRVHGLYVGLGLCGQCFVNFTKAMCGRGFQIFDGNV